MENQNRQQPKQRKKLFDRRFVILIFLHLSIGFFIWYSIVSNKNEAPSALDPAVYREVASRLSASGLPDEAVGQYENYLLHSDVRSEDRANVAYRLGLIYEEKSQYEKALSKLYQAQILNPRSSHADSISRKIVSLLERLGKADAAKKELSRATALKEAPERVPEGALVIAQVGDRKIYQHDLEEWMNTLPQQMKKKEISREEKEAFVKQLVADEILSEKALRLEYDSDPKVLQGLQRIKKQLLVARLLEDEIQKKVGADEPELKKYFKENPSKFLQKERAKVSLIQVKSKRQAQKIIGELSSGAGFSSLAKRNSLDEKTRSNGGEYPEYIYKDEGFLSFDASVSNQILSKAQGSWTSPILSQGFYYIFYLNSKEKEKKPLFSEVRTKVEEEYKREKSQERYTALINEALAGDKVKLYLDRIK